jgi:hypothetical protein
MGLETSRAIAKTVSSRLPTSAARVPYQVVMGFLGAQSGTGAGFLRLPRFPLQILIPPFFSHLLIILLSTLCSPDSDSLGAGGGRKLGTSSPGFFKNQIRIRRKDIKY